MHSAAGRVAAPILGVASVLAGLAASRLIAGSPPIPINVVIWGAMGAASAFLVFASEGPQQRPPSTFQAAMADGVVSGLVTAIGGSVVDLVAASGAGSSSAGSVTFPEVLAAAGLSLLGGAAVGAACGLLALAVGGRDRFVRAPLARRKKPASGKRDRPAQARRKSGKR